MSKIVGIGANVFDTLITVPHYPEEDTKLKGTDIKLSGGGPCATALVCAQKLSGECAYIGNMTDDEGGRFLLKDFERYGVSTEYITVHKGMKTFSSYILLSKSTDTRTCVFEKGNVTPLCLNEKQKQAIRDASLLLVDGNDLKGAVEGSRIARENNTLVLYDAGGLYEGISDLLPLVDILIPSEEFALSYTGKSSVEDAARLLYEKFSPLVVVITMGKKGGCMYDGKDLSFFDAFSVDAVDTNGSGDVFHGAFALAVTRGMPYKKACIFASATSALKCMKLGSREAVPSYEKVIEFLKERGINEF